MAEKTLINGPLTRAMISGIIESIGSETDAGGHSVFIGQVRDDSDGTKCVKAIRYTAYDEMAEAEAEKIKNSIIREFQEVKKVVILHSTGIVKTGEISLFVLVSAKHRHQAFDACNKAVELVKKALPIWKKEIYNDDSVLWKQNDPA
ncbi:MAG: molybdenum cofactor biosynthesis protein MoaE [Bacteroidales bacterium]|jgi:molybdopterin synthase catalytic subunit